MRIGDKIEGMASGMKGSAQAASFQFLTIVMRLLTGLVLGYVLGLIVQEFVQFGYLGVVFFVVVTAAVFFKISSGWSLLKVFLFDIFCVLVLQILKMYILLAP